MDEMLSAWAGVVIVMMAAVLVTLAAMVWILFFRKNARHRRRRRRHQHSDQQQPNPTLAQIGGLPPTRQDDKLSGERPTPTLISRL
jgi:hypothetical protein